jgi:hypothetical protein
MAFSMSRRVWGLSLLAIVVLVAGVGYWRARTSMKTPAMNAAAEARSAQETNVHGDHVVDAAHVSQLVAARGGSTLDSSQSAALGKAVGDALALYQAGTAQDYLAWLGRQGLLPPGTTNGPIDAQWARRTQNISGARFNVDALRVEIRVSKGMTSPPPIHKGPIASISASRPNRGPNDVDPEAAHTDALEVAIPADLRTNDGTPFHGELRLTFARRPADGAWIIIRTGFSGFPPGKTMTSPPL